MIGMMALMMTMMTTIREQLSVPVLPYLCLLLVLEERSSATAKHT